MNFAPFAGHIPAGTGIPTIHQFAAKLGYEAPGVQETRYQGANGMQFTVAGPEGVKFRQGESVVVVSSAHQPGTVTLGLAPLHTVNTGVKYQSISSTSVNLGNEYYPEQLKLEQRAGRREELQHDLMLMQQGAVSPAPLQQGTQQLLVVLHDPKDGSLRAIKQEGRDERHAAAAAAAAVPAEFISIGDVTDAATWQSLGGGVADYLSALPLPLHHLLKYSTEGKREEQTVLTVSPNAIANVPHVAMPSNPPTSVLVQAPSMLSQATNTVSTMSAAIAKKKKKKKTTTKDQKPRLKPGEIRLTTALDGSTLYCCPECHMAYPERGLLDQHLVGHTMERKFICDICNAALKRKDHLTRHKQSHDTARPHECSVCFKAFKRKEQLTLHFVIHSGEKRHVCNDCGKGFYRKDHLRKHTRSHIARRVKAEMSQQGGGSGAGGEARAGSAGAGGLAQAVPAPAPP